MAADLTAAEFQLPADLIVGEQAGLTGLYEGQNFEPGGVALPDPGSPNSFPPMLLARLHCQHPTIVPPCLSNVRIRDTFKGYI